jgi:hypothetical protein
LHWLANDDYFDTLTNVRIRGESRPVQWTVDAKKDSVIFKDFPRSLLKRMGKEKLAFHDHDWTVATKTYLTSPKLANFFKILATDTLNGTEFVMAVQAHKYPIYGFMNHPEAQNMRIFGTDKTALKGKVNDETTDAINFYLSNFLNK